MTERRRTLASSQGTSGIPVPSSAVRANSRQSLANPPQQQHNSRLSIAPGARLAASRGSMVPSGSQSQLDQASQNSQMFSQGHGGASREAPPTVMRGNLHSSSVGMSAARNATLMRSGGASQNEYAPPSQRRSSVYRRSMIAGQATTPLGPGAHAARLRADPREKTANARAKMARDISDYLGKCGEHADPKMLTASTAKDFQRMLKFLLGQMDRTFAFFVNPTSKKFEDEVIPALKAMLYPFPDSITKSHLQSIGSQTSWPNMLAMLHWLVLILENRKLAFDGYPELHMPANSISEEATGAEITAHAWLDYAGKCYPKFLASEDFEPGDSAELTDFYKAINTSRAQLLSSVKELGERNALLVEQSAAQFAEPDVLQAVQDEFGRLERDRSKFTDYLKSMERKIDGTIANSKLHAADKLRSEQQREQYTAEIKSLEAAIRMQNISPEEGEAMKAAYTNTDMAVKTTEQKYADLNKKKLDLEIDLQRALNQTTTLCSTYELKAKQLGILPHPPTGYEHVNFDQEVFGASENPVPDCQSLLRPALIQLRAETKAKSVMTNDEDVLLEEQISLTKEKLADFKDTFESGEAERIQGDQAIQDARDAAVIEFSSVNTEVERLQTAVNQLTSTMGTSLAAAEWRFDQRALERLRVVEETTELRRAAHGAVEQSVLEVLEYRAHMLRAADELVVIAAEV